MVMVTCVQRMIRASLLRRAMSKTCCQVKV